MQDTTCNSSFMLDKIEEIGNAIRNSFHWVNRNIPIHLFMDNAGGHGTNKTKESYIKLLQDKFNIIVKWQVPNSPEMNMLDLGTWMAIQSLVEKKHRSLVMRNDVLANTVKESFNELSSNTLSNIHER